MSFSPTIVPKSITPELRKHFRELSEEGEAFYVDVVGRAGALRNKCVYNAAQEADFVGGEIIYGWSVFVWESVLVQYIGHAIVGVGEKNYCVTPTKHGERKMLFLPDNSLSFDFNEENARMPSILLPISNEKIVGKLIEVQRKIYELKSKYPVSGGQVLLADSDAAEYRRLEVEEQRFMAHTIYLHHPLKAPCSCGSGKQYRKCCRPGMKTKFGKQT